MTAWPCSVVASSRAGPDSAIAAPIAAATAAQTTISGTARATAAAGGRALLAIRPRPSTSASASTTAAPETAQDDQGRNETSSATDHAVAATGTMRTSRTRRRGRTAPAEGRSTPRTVPLTPAPDP
ncbi:hypothetical protein [Microbacterium sp. 22242]|uniref:hypothetical protein n=1 Tax=Microbacterium sp. 22242 TaxID=3453896 RepID=UPI003F857AB2